MGFARTLNPSRTLKKRPKPCFAQLVIILIWLGISPAHAAPLILPSGNSAELIEAMWDDSAGAGTDLRLRFLTPDLDPDTTFEDIEIDLAVLCDAIALPILAETGREVGQIVISISDRPVPFGKTDLKATQHFDTFRPEAGACVWDGL